MSNLYNLTHPQKRIWFTEQLYPNTTANIISGSLALEFELNLNIFLECAENCIAKHNSIHIKLKEDLPFPKFYYDQNEKITVNNHDFSKILENEKYLQEWIVNKNRNPFKLYNEHLFNAHLIKINNKKFVFFVQAHHIIADGYSLFLFSKNIVNCYEEKLNNNLCSTENSNYTNFLENELKYLRSEKALEDKKYWLQAIHKELEPTDLSSLSPKKGEGISAKRVQFKLNEETDFQLRLLSTKYNISLYRVILGCIANLLFLLEGNKNFSLGIASHNRWTKTDKQTFGMYVATVPWFISISPSHTILNYINELNKNLDSATRRSKFPYDLIVESLRQNKFPKTDLIRMGVSYQGTEFPKLCNNNPVSFQWHFSEQDINSITIHICDWDRKKPISFDIDYQTETFDPEFIDNLGKSLLYICNQMAKYDWTKTTVQELNLLSPEQIKKVQGNYTADSSAKFNPLCISYYIESSLEKYSSNIAISSSKSKLTYLELNEEIHFACNKLYDEGVREGSLVAIYLDRKAETVVAIYALLKLGAAFIPIDTETPIERVKYILKNSSASYLLSTNEYEKDYKNEIKYILVENLLGKAKNSPSCSKNKNRLAYIIYTSGSTGKPKGVKISIANLEHYLGWGLAYYCNYNANNFALYSSLSFDLTITSLFLPILSGGTMYIYPQAEMTDEPLIKKVLKDNLISILKLTPAHLNIISKETELLKNSNIEIYIVGGEALRTDIAREIIDKHSNIPLIINEYGPTEATVGCMVHTFNSKNDTGTTVPIGNPIDGMHVWIANTQGKLLPPGTLGELIIAGPAVSIGYHNHESGNKKFFSDPFVQKRVCYRSGDLVFQNAKGEFEYVSRVDRQVKIRGFRIELEEIEAILITHPQIASCAVIDILDEQFTELVAFLVCKENTHIKEIRSFLKNKLSHYMIPHQFLFCNEIPLTKNGKLDRDALALIYKSNKQNILIEDQNTNKSDNPILVAIGKIFNTINIDTNSSFIELGGDSIKAIQVIAYLKEVGYELKIQDLLSSDSIKNLSEKIKSNREKNKDPFIYKYPFSSSINWYLNKFPKNLNFFYQSVVWKTKNKVSIFQIKEAISIIITKHPHLTAKICLNEKMFLVDENWQKNEIEVSEFKSNSNLLEDENLNLFLAHCESIKKTIKIDEGSLFKSSFYSSINECYLFMAAHHFIIDAVSWQIIWHELNEIILLNKSHFNVSEQNFASVQKNLQNIDPTYFEQEIEYWNNILADGSIKKDYIAESGINSLSFEKIYQQNIFNIKKIENTQAILLSAFAHTLEEKEQKTKFCIELESHGREDSLASLNSSEGVGWFTSIFPFLLFAKQNYLETFKETVKNLNITPNKGIGFGYLKFLSSSKFIHEKKYARKIIFNFLGKKPQIDDNYNGFIHTNLSTGPDIDLNDNAVSDLEINLMLENEEIYGIIRFKTDFLTNEKMDIFMQSFYYHAQKITDAVLLSKIEDTKESIDKKVSEGLELSQEDLDILF